MKTICEDVLDHWQTNLLLALSDNLTLDDIASHNCTFCKLYGNTCEDCPIKQSTEMNQCNNTHWYEIRSLLLDKKRSFEKEILINYIEKFITQIEKACEESL